MLALPNVAHEHHDVLLPHVEELAAIARSVGSAPSGDLVRRLAAEHRFITTHLLPHMDRAEATIYPEFERLLQNRHSMTPMRREHATLRALFEELDELRRQTMGVEVRHRLRRVLFRMYAMIEVHLAEEESYLAVLERNLSDAELDELARAMAHPVGDGTEA